MDAADKLVEETPFDKLSVTQICEEAGISRATFYRCFKDKFAIAQWHVELAWAQGANEIGRTLSWKEGYYITEANIASRNLFYAGVAKSNDYNAIDNFAPRLRRKTITETLAQSPSDGALEVSDRRHRRARGSSVPEMALRLL